MPFEKFNNQQQQQQWQQQQRQTNERTNEPLVPDSRFQRWPRRTICIILLVNTRYEVALPDSHSHSLLSRPPHQQPQPCHALTKCRHSLDLDFLTAIKYLTAAPKRWRYGAETERQSRAQHTLYRPHCPLSDAQCHCLFINTNLCSVIKTQNFPGPVAVPELKL